MMNHQIPYTIRETGGRKIFLFKSVSSVLDEAWHLKKCGNLKIWDSVLAETQLNGRGQLRRDWFSPPGNLYAAILLPEGYIYRDERATPFLGFLCLLTLRRLGWHIFIKWPNDIIINGGEPCKIGGILLEEKDGDFISGIGINLKSSPSKSELRPDTSLASSCLPFFSQNYSSILFFWESFLNFFVYYFYKFIGQPETWRKIYNHFLLWHGNKVELSEGGKKWKGILAGIEKKGGIMLVINDNPMIFYNGSVKSI